jgi:hypothetical protein
MMHNPRLAFFVLPLLIVAALILPRESVAEEDQLVGIVVKDLDAVVPPGTFTVQTVEGAQTCELKKAKFRLLQAEKNGGDDPNGGPAGEFVCYKAKCTGPFFAGVTVEDQFGAHDLEAKKTKLVCAPVDKPICGDGGIDPGEQCDGADLGSCDSFCSSACTCAPGCQAITGGFCWFLGQSNQSCDAVCASVARTYASATESYAGSGGSDANCEAVLAALGATTSFAPSSNCNDGVGCAFFLSTIPTRCSSPTTTSSAALSGFSRACACQ